MLMVSKKQKRSEANKKCERQSAAKYNTISFGFHNHFLSIHDLKKLKAISCLIDE